jgi:hypothetical protein
MMTAFCQHAMHAPAESACSQPCTMRGSSAAIVQFAVISGVSTLAKGDVNTP